MMGQYQLKKGRRYKASFKLSGLEQLASNDYIRDMLERAGFANVEVTGEGGVRYASGYWANEDLLGDLPEQVYEVIEDDEN